MEHYNTLPTKETLVHIATGIKADNNYIRKL